MHRTVQRLDNLVVDILRQQKKVFCNEYNIKFVVVKNQDQQMYILCVCSCQQRSFTWPFRPLSNTRIQRRRNGMHMPKRGDTNILLILHTNKQRCAARRRDIASPRPRCAIDSRACTLPFIRPHWLATVQIRHIQSCVSGSPCEQNLLICLR